MTAESVEKVTGGEEAAASTSMVMSIINEIIYSPMNLGLVVIIGFLVYKIIKDRFEVPSAGSQKPAEPELPKLRRDFTVQELRQFDGTQPDGRVLVAVNGKVYDVTKGKRFYGPGGPYATFAGRDASRNLATFQVAANDKEEYDDLSDLSAMEMDSVNEWEMQFKEKYEFVGKLLRKGEQATNYEDEEDDTVADSKHTESTADTEAEGVGKRAAATACTNEEKDTRADSKPTESAADTDEGIRKRVAANATTNNDEVK